MESNYLCSECIWFDQCRRKKICEYFDSGQDDLQLSDAKIEKYHKREKIKYLNAYYKYLDEFENGGNNDIS